MPVDRERPGLTPDGLYWLSKRSGSDYWHRTYFDPAIRQTRRVSLRTADFRAALEALALWWAENRRLTEERPEAVTLDEVLVRYYREHAEALPSATQARIACGKLSQHSGPLAVADFGPAAQRDFCRRMAEGGASPGYIRRTLSVGKAALSWAQAEGLIRSAPVVKLPQDGPGRDRVLSREEVAAVVEAAKAEDHVYRFVLLMLATWSRPDALLDLQADQVDRSRWLVELNPPGRPQTKKYRPTVPLVWRARHALDGVDGGPVITWRGQPVGSIKTAWRRLRKRADLDPGVIPYLLRHTMATEARAAGAPPWEVEGWLGHRRPGTSERYAKYAPDYLAATAITVDRYLAALPLRG